MFEEARSYWRANADRFIAELLEFLRIPSISTLKANAGYILQAAEFSLKKLRALGFEAELVTGKEGEHPLIRGSWRKAPGKPTLMIYAHGDVQPVDPLALWTTPPFEPEIRDGMIWARGSADDKGQLWMLICVLEGYMKPHGALPINIEILFEHEEEANGEHIDRYVRENADRLAHVDATLILDSGMYAPGLPTISAGLRGIVTAEVFCRGAKRDLHSGQYGGAAPNAIHGLARIVNSFHTPQGRVRVKDFYKTVKKPSKFELERWKQLPFDEHDYCHNEVGARALIGDQRYSVNHRIWALPTLEVNGFSGGFTGDGFKTVIPAVASAKVSMRMVPGMDPVQIAAALVEHVRKHTPRHFTSEVKILSTSAAIELDIESAPIQAAAAAFKDVFNVETAFVRCGGSIPIGATIKEVLGKPVLVTGFTLDTCNEHAPNEHFPVAHFHQGVEAIGRYFHRLSQI